jgi:tetratricopeptide (TPR) repeat protein
VPLRRRSPASQATEKPAWQPPSLRETLLHALPLVAIVLAVYVAAAPRTVVLEDDGEFVTAVHFLGVAHPPGYPLFVLLAKPFTWLPIGSIAFRVHVATSFFAALSCGFVWWTARTLLGSAWIAWIAGLSFGFSDTFWSQALIADVYSLNTAIFFALLCLSLAYLQAPSTLRLSCSALLAGLGLSNHWPLLLAAFPGVALIVWPVRGWIARDLLRKPHRIIGPFVLGLMPYAWLVARSQSAPELGFYGAIGDWSEFWHYVSRAGYAHVESNPAAGPWDKVQFAGFLLRECLNQYTLLGAAVIAAGAVAQWRRWGWTVSLGLTATFLGGTLLLVLMVGFEYEYFTRAVFRPYPLISYGVMALWLGLGLAEIGRLVAVRSQPLAQVTPPLLAIAIVALTFQTGLAANDRRDYRHASDYAETLLGSLPPDAVVFGYGDIETFVLGYYHFVEGVRPDVLLLNEVGMGAALDGRLFDPRNVTRTDTIRYATDYVGQTDRPVYFFGSAPFSLSDVDYGFYNRIDRTQDNLTSFEITDELIDLFRRVISEDDHTDAWTVYHRYKILKRFAGTLTAVLALGGDSEQQRYGSDLDQVTREFAGVWAQVWFHYVQGNADKGWLLERIEHAESLANDVVPPQDLAVLYLLKGRVLEALGRKDEAIAALRRSVEIRSNPDGEAERDLRRLTAS